MYIVSVKDEQNELSFTFKKINEIPNFIFNYNGTQ